MCVLYFFIKESLNNIKFEKKKTKNLNTQYPKLTNAIMYGQEIRGTDVVP